MIETLIFIRVGDQLKETGSLRDCLTNYCHDRDPDIQPGRRPAKGDMVL
jgi:hypothetical protein